MMPPSVNAGMCAFPESGRSGTAKTAEIRGRFRPQAVIAPLGLSHRMPVLYLIARKTRARVRSKARHRCLQ